MLSKLMKEHLKVDIAKMRKDNFLQVQLEYVSNTFDRVMKKHGRKNVSACPLCGSTENTKEFERLDSPLLKCSCCELRFHEKIPADLSDVYQDPNIIVYPMDDTDGHYNYRKDRFGRERVKLLERHCGDLSKKKILDVGCGNGYFLSALKETGAKCMGAEFSDKWRKFTMEKTGLPIYGERLENFPEKDFDIITLFDVLEHIEKPIPFIEAVRNLLKPKGHILIYTPNVDSFSLRVMREYSNNVDPSEHLVLFCYKSLEYLGKITGFKIIHSETRGLDIHSILAHQKYVGEKQDSFLIKWVEELQAMIDASGSGDYIRVIFERT